MKRINFSALISVLLCVMVLCTSCGLHRKETTKKTKVKEETEEEETDESTDETENPQSVALMKVDTLDAFISDGSIFAENVPIPTPTPIPVTQSPLGLTNDVDGYFSGPLTNASIVDNEFFRYTIISVELTDTTYVVNAEMENKTDVPYILYFRDPIMDNMSTDWYVYTDTIEPHTVLEDTTDFASIFEDFDGSEPTRLSFLILAIPNDDSQIAILADPVDKLNFIPVNIFPQGEDAFVYQEKPLDPEAMIVYDSEGGQLVIDSFETTEGGQFRVNYSFINKTGDYIQLKLEDGTMTLDKMVFDVGHQSTYAAPYSRVTGQFYVSGTLTTEAGVDPNSVKRVSLPLIAKSLTQDFKVLWQSTITKEVVFG
ncbi:MAG: hypothetical protein J5379_00980 [Clostridiales bacterium]|nr:hypothetical protein [Clostridiales bacterium]